MVKGPKNQSAESRILSAAKKVFLLKGMDGARMQDIADEAGINKALLHYYYRSKEKLFEKIFDEVADAFLPKLEAVLKSERGIFEKIGLICSAYIDQFIQTPYVPIFILNEIHKQPSAFLKKVLKKRTLPVEEIIRQLDSEIKKGNIKPIAPVQLLMNLLSLCIFPFVARPLIQLVANLDNETFIKMMEQRKKEVPGLIIQSLKI